MNELRALFAPRRVAVLGVSRSPAKLDHALLRNLRRWRFAVEVFALIHSS